jgi:hypothetical protein
MWQNCHYSGLPSLFHRGIKKHVSGRNSPFFRNISTLALARSVIHLAKGDEAAPRVRLLKSMLFIGDKL